MRKRTSLRDQKGIERIERLKEMLKMKWRFGVMSICGYVAEQIIIPVLEVLVASVVSLQQIITALEALVAAMQVALNAMEIAAN